jgi:hypothetical protein
MEDVCVVFRAILQEEVLLVAIDFRERAFWKLIARSRAPVI